MVVMRLLVISLSSLIPPDKPGCPRWHCLLRELCKKHEVSLLTTCKAWKETVALGTEQSACNFKQVYLIPELGRAPWWAREFHNLTFTAHVDPRCTHSSQVRRIGDIVAQTVKDMAADVIFARGYEAHCIVPLGSETPVVVDLVDSLSLLHQRLAGSAKTVRERIANFAEAFSMGRLENEVISTRDAAIFISDVDMRHVVKDSFQENSFVVPNGVDSPRKVKPSDRDRGPTIVFSGVMDYAPNVEAAVYLAREIYPRLISEIPNLRLLLVGANPRPDVLALRKIKGVEVTGRVEDVGSYVSGASVYVSPLLAGAGMKNKILQAMALEVPIVASPLSIDGIDVVSERDLLVANDTAEFVKHTLRLLSSPDLCRKLTGSSVRIVRDQYSWQFQVEKLEAVLGKVTGLPTGPSVAAQFRTAQFSLESARTILVGSKAAELCARLHAKKQSGHPAAVATPISEEIAPPSVLPPSLAPATSLLCSELPAVG